MTAVADANERPARLTVLLARARNGVIGAGGRLPWHLPEDLAHFKRTTMGCPIVMGRKTWDSIGRPLPGRRSIVVTHQPDWQAAGAERAGSLDEALALAAGAPEVFVIGGATLYAAALARADRLLLTEIDADFDGDVVLPAVDGGAWRESARESHGATASRPWSFAFVDYRRR